MVYNQLYKDINIFCGEPFYYMWYLFYFNGKKHRYLERANQVEIFQKEQDLFVLQIIVLLSKCYIWVEGFFSVTLSVAHYGKGMSYHNCLFVHG